MAADSAAPAVDPDKAIDVVLAEFNALRAEIDSRATAQAAVVGLGITAVGVIAGFVVQNGGDNRLLLAIPPLALVVNLLIMAETYRAASIGDYIRTKLWPYLQERIGPIPSWEEEVATYRRSRSTLVVALFIDAPAIVLFSGASVAALALGKTADEQGLWVADVVLTAIAIVAPLVIGLVVRGHFGRPTSSRSSAGSA